MAGKYSISKIYSVEGDKIVRKNPFCPKCGLGNFMAVHKGRKYCPKCGSVQKD